jgi:acyl dehydratase
VTRRWLEEFATGDRLAIPGLYEMTPERVQAYAEAYDPQPIHLDAEAAAAEFFVGLVASGWHSLAATARMMVEARPLGDTPLIGASIDNLHFVAPVLPGDTLRVEAEVLETRQSRSRPDVGFLRLRLVTLNQRDEAVLTQDWTLLVPRRPVPGLAGSG